MSNGSNHFKLVKEYQPITTIISPANMDYIFVQFINCLEKSQETPAVRRTVGVSSLMYDPALTRDGKPSIVLLDLDMANSCGDDTGYITREISRCRLGSLSFVASDILGNPQMPHYLRHDLESILYIAIWIAVNYPVGSDEEEQKIFEALPWDHGIFESIRWKKRCLLTDHEEFFRITHFFTSDFMRYRPWLHAFLSVFMNAICEVTNMRAEDDDLDDDLSEEKLLTQTTPQPPDETMLLFYSFYDN
ncbi:hypothetical protein C8Q75DRAFT_805478 [Abortiporus biennis]|nr:hypothetical protein C8Q75DRAFT_805478 [Abortiporus biennis]